MSRPKYDPLIGAMIKKLPREGEAFSTEQQKGWLGLMAMAFQTIYGGEVVQTVSNAQEIVKPRASAASASSHAFYIDASGFVRNKKGRLVNADEVTSEIHDTRGEEGDLGSIQWADGSKGLNGADLTIVTG